MSIDFSGEAEQLSVCELAQIKQFLDQLTIQRKRVPWWTQMHVPTTAGMDVRLMLLCKSIESNWNRLTTAAHSRYQTIIDDVVQYISEDNNIPYDKDGFMTQFYPHHNTARLTALPSHLAIPRFLVDLIYTEVCHLSELLHRDPSNVDAVQRAPSEYTGFVSHLHIECGQRVTCPLEWKVGDVERCKLDEADREELQNIATADYSYCLFRCIDMVNTAAIIPALRNSLRNKCAFTGPLSLSHSDGWPIAVLNQRQSVIEMYKFMFEHIDVLLSCLEEKDAVTDRMVEQARDKYVRLLQRALPPHHISIFLNVLLGHQQCVIEQTRQSASNDSTDEMEESTINQQGNNDQGSPQQEQHEALATSSPVSFRHSAASSSASGPCSIAEEENQERNKQAQPMGEHQQQQPQPAQQQQPQPDAPPSNLSDASKQISVIRQRLLPLPVDHLLLERQLLLYLPRLAFVVVILVPLPVDHLLPRRQLLLYLLRLVEVVAIRITDTRR